MVASRQTRVTRMVLALGLVPGSRRAQTSLLAQNPTAGESRITWSTTQREEIVLSDQLTGHVAKTGKRPYPREATISVTSLFPSPNDVPFSIPLSEAQPRVRSGGPRSPR